MSGRKVMVQPINILFNYLQKQTPITIWLFDNTEMRINGVIKGFDEFMNLVIDDAEEVFEFNKKPGKEVKPSRELAGQHS